jgi:hypothetical protein
VEGLELGDDEGAAHATSDGPKELDGVGAWISARAGSGRRTVLGQVVTWWTPRNTQSKRKWTGKKENKGLGVSSSRIVSSFGP